MEHKRTEYFRCLKHINIDLNCLVRVPTLKDNYQDTNLRRNS